MRRFITSHAGRRIVLRAEGVKRGRFSVAVGTVHLDRIEVSADAVVEFQAALIAALGHTPGRFV